MWNELKTASFVHVSLAELCFTTCILLLHSTLPQGVKETGCLYCHSGSPSDYNQWLLENVMGVPEQVHCHALQHMRRQNGEQCLHCLLPWLNIFSSPITWWSRDHRRHLTPTGQWRCVPALSMANWGSPCRVSRTMATTSGDHWKWDHICKKQFP